MTHHHGDHTGGIAELKQQLPLPRGRAARPRPAKIPLVDETVREGDKVSVGKLDGRVIETPGHTAGHITYWFHADKLAFAGDTLFSIGCGRVIEGTPEMMWAVAAEAARAAGRHAGLLRPRIHAGQHQVRADHRAGQHRRWRARERRSTQLLAAGQADASRPRIDEEKAANPFLRADVPAVAKAVGLAGKPAAEVFAEISARKNKF